jgi:hypothetical protein
MAQITDSRGRPVEITVSGASDDITIDSAYYLDIDADASPAVLKVPEHEIDWIQDHYSDEIYALWFDARLGKADDWHDFIKGY